MKIVERGVEVEGRGLERAQVGELVVLAIDPLAAAQRIASMARCTSELGTGSDVVHLDRLTQAPFELGCRPSPASITPALISSSLYLPIAITPAASGIAPASLSGLAPT